MRLSLRSFAAAAAIAAIALPLAASPASASESRPCWETSGEPYTIDLIIGEFTLNRLPSSISWEDCIS